MKHFIYSMMIVIALGATTAKADCYGVSPNCYQSYSEMFNSSSIEVQRRNMETQMREMQDSIHRQQQEINRMNTYEPQTYQPLFNDNNSLFKY
jgi:hypothetical protein